MQFLPFVLKIPAAEFERNTQKRRPVVDEEKKINNEQKSINQKFFIYF